jgi:hypothetical protein
MEALNKLLSLYKMGFFSSDTQHEALVRRVLGDEAVVKQVSDSMRVLVSPLPDGTTPDPAHVRDSLRLRYPVYYGKTARGLYHEHLMPEVLGYSRDDVKAHFFPDVRYAVCGRVLVDTSSQASFAQDHPHAFVVHAW